MFVRAHMTEKVITVTPETTLRDVLVTLKAQGFEGLPVVNGEGKLVGMVTVWDIHEALHASIIEGNNLSGETRVAEIMSTKLITVLPEEIIEEAAYLMETNDLWLLPVVTQDEQLVGVITESDIYDVFVEMLGLHRPGTRITVRVEDKPGKLAELAGIVKSHNFSIISVATFQPDQNYRNIVVRVNTRDARRLVENIRARGFRVLHVSQVWE